MWLQSSKPRCGITATTPTGRGVHGVEINFPAGCPPRLCRLRDPFTTPVAGRRAGELERRTWRKGRVDDDRRILMILGDAEHAREINFSFALRKASSKTGYYFDKPDGGETEEAARPGEGSFARLPPPGRCAGGGRVLGVHAKPISLPRSSVSCSAAVADGGVRQARP